MKKPTLTFVHGEYKSVMSKNWGEKITVTQTLSREE